MPESFARAYSIMMTEPQGPIYMCYDAALQEAPKTHDVPLPPANAVADALADGARPARDRGDRRQAAQGRAPDAAAGICRPARRRLREHRRAGGDHRRGGVGRQQRAQLPQQAPALPEHGQGRSGRRCRAWARRQGLGEAAHRAQQRQAHPRIPAAAELRLRRDRLSPRSASANGRWTIAACSPARCARSATRRSASPT